MKIPQVLAGSTQVRCYRIRLFRGVAVLAVPNLVVRVIAGFFSSLFNRFSRLVQVLWLVRALARLPAR